MSYKTIPDHPCYEVSKCGKVRRKGKLQDLKPWKHKSGHLYLRLNGKTIQVHRLVLLAHGYPRPEGYECCHLDGNPQNNHLDNLVWGTRRDNIFDYIRHHGKHMKKNATKAEIAKKIKEEHDGKFGTGVRLAKKYGVSVFTVSEIKKGKTFKYV